MDITKLKPVPKNIIEKMKKADRKYYLFPCNSNRFYSYLTTIDRELVKVTVAVKTARDVFYFKQVAVHGIRSMKCWVRDIEYNCYTGMGFNVGWYEEYASQRRKPFEDGKWYECERRYYNPYSLLVNENYLNRFAKYKYSAYDKFNGKCVLEYLRIYEEYPETEYLLKAGISSYLVMKKSFLKKLKTDKNFKKWLISHKNELFDSYYSLDAITEAYKHNTDISETQRLLQWLKEVKEKYIYKTLAEYFKNNKQWLKLMRYLKEQSADTQSYYDYITACKELDVNLIENKNLFPREFKRMHDTRIEEFHHKKALIDEQKRKELYEKFAVISAKYLPLEHRKNPQFVAFIPKSPADLITEGEILHHCVGRMGYDQRFAEEKSIIIFIRSAQDPQTPFVTVEYSPEKHKILQCHGNNNTAPREEVREYIYKKWLPYANRKIKKIAA